MPSNDMDMTHAEIWDDSALIDSWNEALSEYKKYHSIHAKGGRLEDVDLQETSESQTHRTGDSETKAVDQPEIVDDGEVAHETKGAGGSTDVKQPIHPRGNPGRSEKLGIHPSCILFASADAFLARSRFSPKLARPSQSLSRAAAAASQVLRQWARKLCLAQCKTKD